jgi:hypothetical protein
MVNTRPPVLTPATIEEYKRKINPETGKRYTQSDIAKIFGVTKSYVSWIKHKKTSTFSRTPREVAMEHFPWTLAERFNDASPQKRVRDHMEYMATKGKDMSQDKLRRLWSFYTYLEDNDVVVEHDPDIPPSEGIKTGGFAYRKRRQSDDDLIIRVNEYTNLTDQGSMLLQKPKAKPQLRAP